MRLCILIAAGVMVSACSRPLLASPQGNAELPPLLAKLGARLASGEASGEPAESAATRFKSSGGRMTLGAFVNAATDDPDQQASIRTLLEAVFTAYEAAAQKADTADDLAGALAFYIGASYNLYTPGAETDGAITGHVTRQIRVALETAEMRAATDAEKQRLYETYVMMAGLLGARRELAKGDPSATKELRTLGAEGLKHLLGVDASRVKITTEGVRITPAGGASAALLKKPKTLLFTAPAPWVRKDHDDGISLTLSKEEYLSGDSTINVILTEPLPFAGNLQQSFRKYWKEKVLTHMKGEDRPQVLLTLIGGRRCAFVESEMAAIATGARALTRYMLVDGGNALYPVFVLKSLHFSEPTGSAKDTLGQVLATLKVPPGAPPAKPLATNKDLSRNWSTTASSITSYVNTYTGGYAGTSVVAYAQSYSLKPNGTYTGSFGGISNSARIRSKERGKYKLQGDLLVFTESNGRVTKKRFLGIDTPPGASGPLMMLLNPHYPLTSGNIALYGEKYGVKN